MSSPADETVPGGMVPQRAAARWVLPVVVGMLVVVASGCTGDEQSGGDGRAPDSPTWVPGPSATVRGDPLVFTDASVPVVVTTGQDFFIRVPANPTTGYLWRVTEVPEQSVVDLLDPDGFFEPPAEQMPGAGGFQLFEFVALALGTTQIVLTYARPFDPQDNPTVETFTLEVR